MLFFKKCIYLQILQALVKLLIIEQVEMRNESSPDVKNYIHNKDIICMVSSQIGKINTILKNVIPFTICNLQVIRLEGKLSFYRDLILHVTFYLFS
jgi:ERCC4-related helicase